MNCGRGPIQKSMAEFLSLLLFLKYNFVNTDDVTDLLNLNVDQLMLREGEEEL